MRHCLMSAESCRIIAGLDADSLEDYLESHNLTYIATGRSEAFLTVFSASIAPLVEDVVERRVPRVRSFPDEQQDPWLDLSRTGITYAATLQQHINRGERIAVFSGAQLLAMLPDSASVCALGTFVTRHVLSRLANTSVVLPPGNYHGVFMIIEPAYQK